MIRPVRDEHAYIPANPGTFTPAVAPIPGNLLVISAHTRGSPGAANALAAITGWTIVPPGILAAGDAGRSQGFSMFYRFALAGDTAWTIAASQCDLEYSEWSGVGAFLSAVSDTHLGSGSLGGAETSHIYCGGPVTPDSLTKAVLIIGAQTLEMGDTQTMSVVPDAGVIELDDWVDSPPPSGSPGRWSGYLITPGPPSGAYLIGGVVSSVAGVDHAGITAVFTDDQVSGSAPRGLSGAPEYVVELYNSGATFGPNAKLAEIWDARNVGWSRYDRLAGKAFFTLSQTSAVLPLFDELLTHIAIWRITPSGDTLVYRGVFIDRNATGDDVILDFFDYISLLSVSRSGFKTLYPTKLLGTEIVSPEWLLAKNATSSPLGFVTTGTIEDPLGTDGVTPIKTNAQFGTLDQTRLQLFFDLTEMGRANTINHVTYEIDLDNAFHFYKNRGGAADIAFVLGGNITDYQWLPGKARYRNDVATIGAGGAGGAAEIVATNAAEILAKGRRQDVTTLKTLAGISGGGTEADQQKAALERELKRLVQQTSGLALKVARGRVEPFVGWSMNDTALIEIENGDDLITGSRRIVGVRCLFTEAGEDIDVIVNEVVA